MKTTKSRRIFVNVLQLAGRLNKSCHHSPTATHSSSLTQPTGPAFVKLFDASQTIRHTNLEKFDVGLLRIAAGAKKAS
jgi:hypothetical protein